MNPFRIITKRIAKKHASFQGYISENETHFKNVYFESIGSILE
jgi:hypothetical protein